MSREGEKEMAVVGGEFLAHVLWMGGTLTGRAINES